MAHEFENNHNMYRMERPMEVVTVPQGIILPQKEVPDGPMWGLGGVCDSKGEFVPLSYYDGGWATHGGGYQWENEAYIDCDVVYFGMFFNHWGHFLVDLLGRLWYFAQNKGDGLKLAYLGTEAPRGNFLEFFSLLGIQKENLLHITEPTRFRNVIVPEFSCKSCVWYSDEYRTIFDSMIDTVNQEGYVPADLPSLEKVYFTRLAFGKAKSTEIGENNIAKWLECNGFSLIAPEKLSIRDQIYVWNHAGHIVCLDGSIPISVAFSNNPALKLTILHKTHLEHLNVELYLLMRQCQAVFLDAYWEPFKKYPKNIGAGPFLFHITADLQDYSSKMGWKMPFSVLRLHCAKIKNWCKLVLCIWNIKGRIRIFGSKVKRKLLGGCK
ncbi:MAG: glycosyltransferase family 61 protein [Ruminococcaceae bacterium]|nr:glycosyltransferase family 61 protein [Oscillospiraceae bacterium]